MHVRPGFEHEFPFELYEHKYQPDQPRVPVGSPDGGQWTSEGAGGSSGSGGRSDTRVISDATPDPVRPGARYAQNRPRSAVRSFLINGQFIEPTPAQAARLTVVEAQAQDAIRRVQEYDPSWKPRPSEYESVEGLISSYQADARQAQDRISELRRVGVGPGPFAIESFPARNSGRNYHSWEYDLNNKNGSESGCHTCGTFQPGTLYGNYVLDHQPPSALNWKGLSQQIYPQCLTCSLRQGGWVNQIKRRQ